MKKVNFIVTSLLLLAVGSMPEFAHGGSSGLRVSVVDKNSNGVQSEIYAESGTFELKIGTTDSHGQFFDNDYRCNGDRDLIAKPIDRTYFDSPAQPCKSPEKLLVISRLAPNGHLAFGGFSRSFKSSSGNIGQVNYAATIETTAFNDIREAGGSAGIQSDSDRKSECAFAYKIDGNKSKFLFKEGKWEQVEEVNEPANKLVILSMNDINKSLGNNLIKKDWAKAILKTDTGFIAFTNESCDEAREAADKLRSSVEKLYVAKFNEGQYNENNDQFFISGNH